MCDRRDDRGEEVVNGRFFPIVGQMGALREIFFDRDGTLCENGTGLFALNLEI
ncbi:MAG: hypothetical protein LBH53_01980 [Puniceicoccales bacterium]|nr:hypothetical protein [Puniceicoccales bacterium]